jgi:cadmium resistance protein CadD (predicted permease)
VLLSHPTLMTLLSILLFSTPGLPARNVIIGQFLGIVFLVIITATAALLVLVIPLFVIGLMGLIPIGIGIKKLTERRGMTKEINKLKLEYLSFISVAGITIANGGDDIGVFTPLFAKYSTSAEVIILVMLFMILTGIWCLITHYFIKHPFVASRINRLSHIMSPLALIGLGLYIILDSFVF